jgi:hypothetical protein
VSGLATFFDVISFSQQAVFSEQAVLALALHSVFSEQSLFALLVAFVLPVLPDFAEAFTSPANATGSEAKQANVKQTMSFFIMVSWFVPISTFY